MSPPVTQQPIPPFITPVQTPKVPTVNIPKRELIHERVGGGEGKHEDEPARRKILESPPPEDDQSQSSPSRTEPWIQPPSPPIQEPLIAFED